MIFLTLLLCVIPVTAHFWARRRYSIRVGFVTGVSWGLVASPFSLGLFSLAHIPIPYIAYIGVVGGALFIFHGSAGFEIATWVGLHEAGTVVSGSEHIQIEMINGMLWGAIYGAVGFLIDVFRSKGGD